MAGNSFIPEPSSNFRFFIYSRADLSKDFWHYEIVFEHDSDPGCAHTMKVNNSGCVITCADTEQEYEWNYSGEGQFLGFSTEQNGEIVYGISDDVYNMNGISILYVVANASLQSENLTGAKLKFLDIPNFENGTWQINFKTNNQNFTSFTVEDASLKEYSITINGDYVNHTGSWYINIDNRPTSIKVGETLTFSGTVYTNCDVECTGADLQYESISNSSGSFVPEIGTQPYTFTLSNATNDVVITFVDGNMLPNGGKPSPEL